MRTTPPYSAYKLHRRAALLLLLADRHKHLNQQVEDSTAHSPHERTLLLCMM
jgi:hypothetical protein